MSLAISGAAAIVGVAETDYVRGAELSVPELILQASVAAIADAGLRPSDVDGVIPPPGFISTEEIAAHLGIPEVRYSVTVHMGGASPTAALQSATMAIASGIAECVLVTLGWNGYSAMRPRPGVERTRRRMDLGPVLETSRNFYVPYGVRSAAQWYSLYLQRYVDTYDVQPEDAAEIALGLPPARAAQRQGAHAGPSDEPGRLPRLATHRRSPPQAGLLPGDRLCGGRRADLDRTCHATCPTSRSCTWAAPRAIPIRPTRSPTVPTSSSWASTRPLLARSRWLA